VSVAIIGSGLAGLSAAYTLERVCRSIDITIFERDKRSGGRIFTSRRPPGEHGAEFVLGSDGQLLKLLRILRIGCHEIKRESRYFFRGRCYTGRVLDVIGHLSSESSASRLRHAVCAGRRMTTETFRAWLSQQLGDDQVTRRFVEMILHGETCAPVTHVDARYGRDCLYDLLCSTEWYRIKGGMGRLVEALVRCIGVKPHYGAAITRVFDEDHQIRVTGSVRGRAFSRAFDAVILAIPDGERLLRGYEERARRRSKRHFHSYISVLLQFKKRWEADDDVSFSDGLYVDGPLNFIEEVPMADAKSRVLRVLIPDARRWLALTDSEIVRRCLRELRSLPVNFAAPTRCSVARWRYGLPCGPGVARIGQVSRTIYLAGDRFGEWPSMNTAIRSGRNAAKALARVLNKPDPVSGTAGIE
jgi:protoporphyrinogen oxidase